MKYALSDKEWQEYNKRQIAHVERCLKAAEEDGHAPLIKQYSEQLLRLQRRYGSTTGNNEVG